MAKKIVKKDPKIEIIEDTLYELEHLMQDIQAECVDYAELRERTNHLYYTMQTRWDAIK